MLEVLGYDHVGIRVTDRARSLDFYARLGFRVDPESTNQRVAEITAANGTRINLIFNGAKRDQSRNILIDEDVKFPGYTHAAFIVGRLDDVIDFASREGIPVTEGPVDWGRRLTCFIRDPDGNVLELNQLKEAER